VLSRWESVEAAVVPLTTKQGVAAEEPLPQRREAEEVAPPGTKSGVEVAVHPRMESGAAVVLLRWESAEAVAVHPTTKQGVVVAERPRRRVEAEAHCSRSEERRVGKEARERRAPR